MNGHAHIPDEDEEDLQARREQEGREAYERYNRETGRPRLGTLNDVSGTGAPFALNEITGDMRSMGAGRRLLIQGVSPTGKCALLFDKEAVDRSWAPVGHEEALDRLQRHGLV